jgi:hypothetical protein
MSIIVTPFRPIVPAPQETYWGQPIRAQTVTQLAVCSAHMAVVKSLMHITRRYDYDRNARTGTAKITGLNPTGQDTTSDGAAVTQYLTGRSGVYRITLPHTNPWASGVEVAILYQAHSHDVNADTNGSEFGNILTPSMQLKLETPAGVSIDPTPAAVGNGATYATEAGGVSAAYPLDVDGRVEDPGYHTGYKYPVKRILFVSPPAASYAAAALPSTPRSLLYDSSLAGGAAVLVINWQHVRILQVDINERPKLIID